MITVAALVPNRRRRRRRSTSDSWLSMVLAFPSPIFASVTRSQIFCQSNRILLPSLAHTITFLRSVFVFLFFSLFLSLFSLMCKNVQRTSAPSTLLHGSCFLALSQPRRRRRRGDRVNHERSGRSDHSPFPPLRTQAEAMRAAPLLRSGERGAKDRPKTVYA